jgi:hypothetical protein
VVFNALGHAVSDSAILTVNGVSAPAITSQPISVVANAGNNANFTVGVSGTAPFSYYWQVSAPGTGGWADLSDGGAYSGTRTATLTVTAAGGLTGSYYRCVVFNALGHAVSDSAILTVNGASAPVVLTQPVSTSANAGANATFTVGLGGTAPFSYYWQVSAPGTGGWVDLSDGGAYSGTHTASLTVTAAGSLTGSYYRCVVFNALGYAVSNSAILTVNGVSAPAITTQPASLSTDSESTATFTVGVSGTAPFSYYWQLSTPNSGSWTDLTDGTVYSGTHTPTLTVTLTVGTPVSFHGNYYRCVVFNALGYAASDSAILTVNPANFTVTMSGTSLRYYWQLSAPGDSGWTDLTDGATYSGTHTNTLTVAAALNLSGNSYRCVAMNRQAYAASNSAVLTVSAGAPREPTVLLADDFEKSLSAWVRQDDDSRGASSWTVADGRLEGSYPATLNAATNTHSFLLLADTYQPAGNWRASVDFTRVGEAVAAGSACADFSLWLNDSAKLSIQVGQTAGGAEARHDVRVRVTYWNGIWSEETNRLVPGDWVPGDWNTAILEKRGNEYRLRLNDTEVLRFVDARLNGQGRLGLHTSARGKLDDFLLEALP